MTIFDDDDDAEPQLKVVDNYYFEKAKNEFVCFSALPLKFDENDKVSGKGIYLHRYSADGTPAVYKQVVAWTVALDREQPKISVLSSEGYWIELDLLKPRKIYWKFARSALTTVQMLHFVKRQPRKPMRSLCVHLREVFRRDGGCFRETPSHNQAMCREGSCFNEVKVHIKESEHQGAIHCCC